MTYLTYTGYSIYWIQIQGYFLHLGKKMFVKPQDILHLVGECDVVDIDEVQFFEG